MELIDRVSALIEQGQESKLTTVVEQLEAKTVLPVELQDKLAAMGDTPISEPKVFKAIEKAEDEGYAVIALNILSEPEIIKYDAVVIGDFIHAVTLRVKSYKTEDGIFKTTVNTEGCRLPNFIEVDKIRKVMIKRDALLKAWMEAAEGKGKMKAQDGFVNIVTELSDLCIKISGLDTESLSDWEKALIMTQVIETAANAFSSSMGKKS